MPHLLHIGMPNCLSKTIQNMFSQDEENFYMGMKPNELVAEQVVYAIETELTQVPGHHYNEGLVKQLFGLALEAASESRGGALILSDDTITDGFTKGGVSYDERMARFAGAMPADTTVLMIVRNPVDYLKAHYRHLIMTRCLPISYNDYVQYLLVRGSKSFLGLLDYASLLGVAQKYFADVEVVMYEQALQDDETIHRACVSRGITIDSTMSNRDLDDSSDALASVFQSLCLEHSGALSGHPDLTFDVGDVDAMVKNSPLFEKLLLRRAVAQAGTDNLLEAAGKIAALRPDATIDYSLDPKTEQMLDGYIAQVNGTLAAATGLPLSHHGYNMGEDAGTSEVAAE